MSKGSTRRPGSGYTDNWLKIWGKDGQKKAKGEEKKTTTQQKPKGEKK